MLHLYNLEQVVEDPTRDRKILDLSNLTLITSVIVQPGFGDHDMVRTESSLSPKR